MPREDDDIPSPDPTELHAALEDMHGKPLPVSAAEGVRLMQRRIDWLELQLKICAADTQGEPGAVTALEGTYRRELADVRRRLAEYQTQAGGLN